MAPRIEPLDEEAARIVERPDGFYWLCEEGKHEVGPFATFEDAIADMRAAEESDIEPGETLAEAEDEVGIADWIDPDTGEPAEEHVPRTEQH